jgi:hypothetical protein
MVAVPVAVVAAETVPHPGEHETPFCVSVQLALTFALESLVIVEVNGVAFNAAVAPTGIIALPGEISTVMAGTLICIEPCWAGFDCELAITLTNKSLAGGLVGAV